MRVARRFIRRLRLSATRQDDAARLQDEFRDHIERQTDENRRAGMTPTEAHRQAVLAFGPVEAIKDQYRNEQRLLLVEILTQDLRVAWHGLWRAKAFTVAAVLTLAVGIAGTTIMFALVEGVLLRPLPVRQQDNLIVAWKELRTSGSARYPFGNTEIDSLARSSQLLETVAGVTRNGVERAVVIDAGVSSYANVGLVTGGFFDVLGVQPILGRPLTRSDDREGAENVIVVSRGFWRRCYGGSPAVVGRRLTIGDQLFTIVGVMPSDLDYPAGVEIWRTTSSVPTDGPFGDAARQEVNLLARLRPGVTIAQAASEITTLSQRLEAEAPATAGRGFVPAVRPFFDVIVGDVRTAIFALFAAMGLVLLIATANVANLLLMRGESRRGELAVRAALGAGRGRLVRHVLAESVVLSVVAGAVGFVATWWGLPALTVVLPEGLPRLEAVRIDGIVVAFSIGVVFVTAFLAGLGPGLLSVPRDLLSQLRAGGRVTGSAATRGRRTLVVAQVALTVTVLAAAGLLVRSVLKLQSVDLGLAADRLVMLDLHLPQTRYAERRQHAQLLDDLIAQLEATPAIVAATPVNLSPFSGQGWDVPQFTADGQGDAEAALNPSLNLESVHPNYFETFEIPLVSGRAFTTADRAGALDVAIVSEDVAAQIWPGKNAVGKKLKMGLPTSPGGWYTVVGVAAHTRYRDVTALRPTLYLPAAQFQMTATMLVLRTTASIELVASLARERIATVDPDVRVMRVVPFAEMLARPLARPRFDAVLLGLFGTVALSLSALGLYALMAAFVRQRDKEIALRLALGASASAVRRLVLTEAVRLASVGAAIGLAATVGSARLLRGMLYEVDPLDPFGITAAALLLIGVSALASYFPARRATRIDATAMLRSQ